MAMKPKVLIVAGLPKSGTTFLYAQAARRPDAFALPRGAKEVDYFRRGRDPDAYRALFDGEGRDGRVLFDASPLYIDDIEGSLANMRTALAGWEVRVIVCLRDPLERAFSHYLHDAAQHQKLFGHGDFGFWSPTVMARYLFPVAPRVARLQEVFGKAQVAGFAFGANPGETETVLRDFANLGPDWRLDFSENPAPGFTAPQSLYNADAETEVPLQGRIHRLPPGHLLVINRQFSLYRDRIDRAVAERIVLRQATLTRRLDTGMLRPGTRARLCDDMARAAAMLGLDMPLSPDPRVYHARPSEDLPAHILDRLTPLCAPDAAIAALYDHPARRSTDAVTAMPFAGASLPREMARLTRAWEGGPDLPPDMPSVQEIQRRILRDHGPVPLVIESLMTWEVLHGRHDVALALFDAWGGADRLLWPMDLAHVLKARGVVLPPEVADRFRAAGIRTALPEDA